MINTTAAYKKAIKKNRVLHHKIEILFADGRKVTSQDQEIFSFQITENTSNTNSFDIGAAISSQLTLKLDNHDGRYDKYDFNGSRITASVGLELSDGTTEWLKKGTYISEPGKYSANTLSITANDNMIRFDQSYSLSKLVYPATLNAIVRDACECCGVSLAADTAKFDNDSYIVETKPQECTFRQVLQWVGQISCKFSRINTDGRLTLNWYDTDLLEASWIKKVEEPWQDTTGDNICDTTGTAIFTIRENVVAGGNEHTVDMDDSDIIQEEHVLSGTFETDDVVITGISVEEETSGSGEEDGEKEDITYHSGAEGYELKITGNKLIQGGSGATVAAYLGERLIGLQFRPASLKCQSDPAREAGDLALIRDFRGNIHKTIFTGVTYTAGAAQTLECGAESPEHLSATRYSEATQVYKILRSRLTRQNKAWENAFGELKNAMESKNGLFPISQTLEDGSTILYFCDKPTLEESQIIVKLNASGWGMSTDSGKTWNIGALVDGTMITKILNSIGINADWINSGAVTISDEEGNTTFKADTKTGRVDIIANSFQLRGKTVEEITKETAKNYVDEVIGDSLKDINTQYFGKYDPTLSNMPASEWTDISAKNKHLNDIFYNTDTKKMFRFVKNGNTYTWENFTDPDIQAALDNAAKAQDTADRKRRVFMATPTPPYDAGDMWVTSATDGKADIKICKTAKAEGGVFSSADWIDPAYVDSDDVQGAINNYDTSLGQQEIFNKLTNNGKNKGIYIQNGELYINANYILSGVLAGKLINGKGLKVTDKNNEVTLKIDDDGNVYIKATEFTLQGKNIEEVISEKSDKFKTLSVSLSNVFQAIPVDMNGKYTSFPSCTTTVTVLYGDEDVTDTSIISFKTSSGVSGSASKNVYTVTGLSTDTGIVTVKVERGSLTVEKQFTVVKQKQGIQGLQGLQGKDGATGAAGKGISSVATYYMVTSVSSGVSTSTSGWTTSIQTPTASKPYLWSYQTTYYTDSTSSSTTPHIVGIRGTDGKDPGELTQQQIFNILTNNGQTQGIYLLNGKVYINGEYIETASITASALATDSVTASKIAVEDLYSIGAKIGGFSISQNTITHKTTKDSTSYYDTFLSSAEGRLTFRSGDGTNQYMTISKDNLRTAGYKQLVLRQFVDSGDDFGSSEHHTMGRTHFTDLVYAQRLQVTGSKQAVRKTENYGEKGVYCYETPTPMFGDVGAAEIGEDGKCYVDIDDVLKEMINTELTYYVFLQKTEEGELIVSERHPDYFVVKGTPGHKFFWEIKARQKGFEEARFEDAQKIDLGFRIPDYAEDYDAEKKKLIEDMQEVKI